MKRTPRIDGLEGFRQLGAADRQRVATATRELRVDKGAAVFLQGQPADGVWAVKQGVIHIVKSGRGGRETVLEVIPPGELFGAIVALENRPYPASALAAEPSVVWCLPASLARELCQTYPTLRSAILAQVTDRLRSAHERLQSVATEPVEQRLARMLLVLAKKLGQRKDGTIILSVTRQELADMIGSTVETTIRTTSKWQHAGIVRSSRNELRLTDPTGLRRIASGDRQAAPSLSQ